MADLPIRVIIADDHEIVRRGIRLLLEEADDIEVIGEAENGAEAISLVEQLGPDLVVMDISMPDVSGIEATRTIKRTHPDVEVVGLTMHAEERYFYELLKAGAAGYVIKGGAPHELLTAIRAAAQGDAYVHPTLARRLIKDYVDRADSESTAASALTEREREVLQLIVDGLTSRAIAERLIISANTVERHRSNIMAKLDLHNKAELVRYAIRRGLVEAD